MAGLRFYLFVCLLAHFSSASPVKMLAAPSAFPAPSRTLREQIQRLAEALNKRDLETIRLQISQSRIFVEIGNKAGAYLTSSQTIAVVESFIKSRSAISTTFDFVSDDGRAGSASGTLSAIESGRSVIYRLDFGFVRAAAGDWRLGKIKMK